MTDDQLIDLYTHAQAIADRIFFDLGASDALVRRAAADNDGPPEPTDGMGPYRPDPIREQRVVDAMLRGGY